MLEKSEPNGLERLTVLVGRAEIKSIKHAAVDRGVSTSAIIRTAVNDYLKTKTEPTGETIATRSVARVERG